MPVLDGLETLVALRKLYPRLPVIMFSTLTERGAASTLDALALGATDYVTKPANVGSVSTGMQRIREELIPKIKALCGRPPAPAARGARPRRRRRRPGVAGPNRPARPASMWWPSAYRLAAPRRWRRSCPDWQRTSRSRF